jgi:hypothetical protein
LNSFNCIDAVILEPKDHLEAYFWDELHVVSPWTRYWSQAAKYRRGLRIDYPAFKNSLTNYYGMHVDCEEKDMCNCEHNCGGTHTTKGRAVTNSDATIKP